MVRVLFCKLLFNKHKTLQRAKQKIIFEKYTSKHSKVYISPYFHGR